MFGYFYLRIFLMDFYNLFINNIILKINNNLILNNHF